MFSRIEVKPNTALVGSPFEARSPALASAWNARKASAWPSISARIGRRLVMSVPYHQNRTLVLVVVYHVSCRSTALSRKQICRGRRSYNDTTDVVAISRWYVPAAAWYSFILLFVFALAERENEQ